MDAISIKCVSETEIPLTEVFQLVHDSFQQWIDNGLESAVARYSLDDYIEKTSNATIIVAVSSKGELLGTHTLVFDKPKCCFGKYLAVSPNAKRLGIGKLLFEKEVELAKQHGCEYLLEDTGVDATWSVKWHTKMGYKIVGYKSFSSNNYFSYIFRKQLVPSKKYDCEWYCKVLFMIQYIVTKLMRTRNGHPTIIGKICLFLYKGRVE